MSTTTILFLLCVSFLCNVAFLYHGFVRLERKMHKQAKANWEAGFEQRVRDLHPNAAESEIQQILTIHNSRKGRR